MTANEIAHKATQLAASQLASTEMIEGRLSHWRRTHGEMAETLAQAAKAIDALQLEREVLYQQIEDLKANGCPVGPVRRFWKSLWTQ